ncbi:hypothetical protein K504DRAFT_393078, partial [Pleomassaria siparia CBS 279.74]
FSFPALAVGPPSKRNWYKELLDHPDCPVKVREAYQSLREEHITIQIEKFISTIVNPVTPGQALIKHLERQPVETNPVMSSDDRDSQPVNCLVIWARPPPRVRHFIQVLQERIESLVGDDVHLIPEVTTYISPFIELSHRHPVNHMRSVVHQIGSSRIQNILDLSSRLASKPKFVSPQLGFDDLGIAVNVLPAEHDAYTYHHLRSDVHALAIESGVSIDMCYAAPSAHVTLERFVGSAFFDRKEKLRDGINSALESNMVWSVVDNASLELELGYLKYGRGTEKADILGQVKS